MNSKEIFKKAVKLEKTERVPVIILSGGVWAYNEQGKSLQDSFDMPPEKSADYLINMIEKVKSDLIWCADGCNNLVLRALGARTEFSIPGKSAEAYPFLSSPRDVDKLSLEKIKEDPGIIAMLESTKIMKKKIDNQTMLAVSQWGPITLGSLMLGTTEFVKKLRKDRDSILYLLEFTKEVVITYWNLFLDAGVEHVSQAEPAASGDMISPRMFEDLVLPCLRNTNERIGDKPFSKMIHICGNTTNFLDALPDTKADMFSMDYKVSLKIARGLLNGRMAFAGKMNPSDTMLSGSTRRVQEDCEACISDADWSRGGYIMMPGCDLPPNVPLENLQTMVRVAHSHTQTA